MKKNLFRIAVINIFTFFIVQCIYAQPSSSGKDCITAAPLYNMDSFTLPVTAGSNGFQPPCFANPMQQPSCFKFAVLQPGLLNWTAVPSCSAPHATTTEFDWAVYDITAGCAAGISIGCNYNYAGVTTAEGMQGGPGAGCLNDSATHNPALEICSGVNVLAGHIYAIYIDQFSVGDTCSINFNFNGSTFQIDSSHTLNIFDPAADKNVFVKLFPNPFSQATHIVVTGLNQQFSFDLFDVTGRLVKHVPSVQNNEFLLSRNDLSSGVYLYRISISKGQVAYGKLVVE